MSPRPHSREAILEAAEMVVLDIGAAHLTFEAVAERAGVSKGGLIYHFPSKDALLEAMVSRLLQRFTARQVEAAANLPAGPQRDLAAYVLAAFTDADEFKRISANLLAVAAHKPKLLAPVREYFQEWYGQLEGGALSFARAAVICLAVDGLWLLELLQLSPLDDAQRNRVYLEILRLMEGSA